MDNFTGILVPTTGRKWRPEYFFRWAWAIVLGRWHSGDREAKVSPASAANAPLLATAKWVVTAAQYTANNDYRSSRAIFVLRAAHAR